MCLKEMMLPVYSKVPNKETFEIKHIWTIKKGWYDDGKNQFIVEYESVPGISSFRKHYYRFPLFGQESTGRYYWLILSPIQNIRFSIMQYGFHKTIVAPVKNVIQVVKNIWGSLSEK